MFNYPLTEIFSAAGEVRNVFDADTYAQLLKDGWLETAPVEPAPELLLEPAAAELSPAQKRVAAKAAKKAQQEGE
jgi:hypothetical protein